MSIDDHIPNVNILLCIFELPTIPGYHGAIIYADVGWACVELEPELVCLHLNYLP